MDWYQWFTGRPSPGQRAPTPASKYLSQPQAATNVYGPGAVGGENTVVPRVTPQSDAPRRARGAREYVARRAHQDQAPPQWVQQANETRRNSPPRARQSEMAVGPGGVVPRVDNPSNSNHIPLAVASGESDAPFGEDFSTWYEFTHGGRPLPSSLRDDTAPSDETVDAGHAPRNANNIPLGVEGGETVAPTRLERNANDHAPVRRVYLPPVDGASDEPDFDQDWREASQRAFERAQANRPSMADMIYAAINGADPRRVQVVRENDQMRDQIRSRN